MGLIFGVSACMSELSKDSDGELVQTKEAQHLRLKSTKGIRSLLEDRQGNLWMGGPDLVCVFDGKKLIYLDEADGLCGKGASRMQEDQDGNIWIQAGATLCKYEFSDSLNTLGENISYDSLEILRTDKPWDTSPGDLWFKKEGVMFDDGNSPPGVFRYRESEFTFLAFPVPQTENTNHLFNWMTEPLRAQDGTQWFATMGAAFGFKDGGFTIIGREEMGLVGDPRYLGIRAIFEDSKGNIWLGDNGCGLFVYDGDTTINFTQKHKLGQEDKKGNNLDRIFSISEDREGNMWFGTVYSGIWRYNPRSDDFSNFTEKDGLLSELIWTIYKRRNGDLLFAGEDPGAVYSFNGNSFEILF